MKKLLALIALVMAGCTSGPGGGTSGGEYGFGKPLPGINLTHGPRGLESRAFTSADGNAMAPMDFTSERLALTFDVASKRATGRATIEFSSLAAGRPYFLLDATVISARLGGQHVKIDFINSPAAEPVARINRVLGEGEKGVLEIEFELPSARITWNTNGIGFLTDMSDVGVHFFERFGPANYEDDPFELLLDLKIETGTVASHTLFANGEVTKVDDKNWSIHFAPHYTSSSFFVHLTDRPLFVKSLVVKGSERDIPVTLYSTDETRVTTAAGMIQGLFDEIESHFGPYAHPGFIAYLSKSSGGMEHVGATVTSLKALSHELFHSWFARGVMPAEGRSGWIDEGLASWRDKGYPRASTLLSRDPTTFENVSIFERNTPSKAYAEGRALMAELDLLFEATGGLRPLLKKYFERYRLTLITNAEFENALEEISGGDVTAYFERYVADKEVTMPAEDLGEEGSLHPTPLTEEELRDLR